MTASLAKYRIDTKGASLPVRYTAAKEALAECHRVDECKDWADKALALKSYAKQAEDDELYKTAARIQGRAVRRIGELLEEIAPKQGARTDLGPSPSPGSPTRKSAATDAGISNRQRKTALRVARVPSHDFERQIESADPPTVTELARQGTKHKSPEQELHERVRTHLEQVIKQRPEYPLAIEAGGHLRRFAEFCREHKPKAVAHGFEPSMCKDPRNNAAVIQRWLTAFADALEA